MHIQGLLPGKSSLSKIPLFRARYEFSRTWRNCRTRAFIHLMGNSYWEIREEATFWKCDNSRLNLRPEPLTRIPQTPPEYVDKIQSRNIPHGNKNFAVKDAVNLGNDFRTFRCIFQRSLSPLRDPFTENRNLYHLGWKMPWFREDEISILKSTFVTIHNVTLLLGKSV